MNMRKTMIATLVAGTLATATVIGTASAAPYGTQDRGVASGYVPAHFGDRHGMRGDRGMRGLNLTQEQRDQIFQITYEQEPKLRDLHKAMRARRQALRDAATAKQFDKAKVQALADEQAKLEAQMIVMRTETRNKIYNLLTDDQRAQLAQRQERRGRRM